MELWHNICREAAELAEAVGNLPDTCACGRADAHLAGACPCCAGPGRGGDRAAPRMDCREILGRLFVDVIMLSGDLGAAGPPLEAAALESRRFELRRGVFLAASSLQQLVEAFRRTMEAVAGFRRECALTRMQAVKRSCAELREHCERVNAELQQSLA